MRVALSKYLSFLIAFVTLFLTSLFLTSPAQAATDTYYLHGTGSTANPAVLFLNTMSPSATTAKYNDSSSVHYSGGNPWQTIGSWPVTASTPSGNLTTLGDLHTWVGLPSLLDVGARFDIKAEIQKNGTTIAQGQINCANNLTLNPNSAKPITIPFATFSPVSFSPMDTFSAKLSARLGTNPNGSQCHFLRNSATGLRQYFDSTTRQSRFGATFEPFVSPKIYVANTDPSENNVSVIDGLTNAVITTIPVGEQPRSVVASPILNRVYVANTYSASVAVIDSLSDTVISTIPVQGFPLNIAVNHAGTRVYTSDFGPDSTVSVIDTSTNTVIETLTGFSIPQGITFSNDDSKVYIMNGENPGSIKILDTTDYSEIATIPVDDQPLHMAILPDGSFGYATSFVGGSGTTVSVIDLSTNTVVETINVEPGASDIVVNSNGTELYVTSALSNVVSVIDTTSNTVTDVIPVGETPNLLDISADDSKLYVANTASGGIVSVIDTSTKTVVGEITVGISPWGVATLP